MGTAFLSDRLQMRGLFCVIFGSISVLGYGILLADVATSVHYFACFLVAGGLYVVVGLPLAWVRLFFLCAHFFIGRPVFYFGVGLYILHLSEFFYPTMLLKSSVDANLRKLPNNSPRYGKRATSTGLQLTFGNAAGVMSAFI